jgi:hypothetical protein
MISKKLAIAAAFVFLAGAPALAQDAAPAPAGMADQAAPAAGTPDQPATPATPGTPAGTDQMAAQPAAPAPAADAPAAEAPKAGENPYGLYQLWANGDFVAKSVIVLRATRSPLAHS